MTPTPGDVHVNAPLTNISIAFLQNSANFVATNVFPNIPVQKQSDRYYVYERGDFNRDEMQLRAPATASSGGGYTLDNTPTYFANRFSFHKDIPDELRANADAVLSPDREAAEFITHKALIKREKLFSNTYFKTGVWTYQRAGVAGTPTTGQFKKWNDATSTPIKDVRLGKAAIAQSTGFEPNKLVMGRSVYDAIVDHPEVIDRLKYGQTAGAPAMASRQALASLFAVDEILIMNAIENTAAEGATAAHSFIGGNHCLLTYSTNAPGLMTPSAGYTFSWTGLLGSGADGNRIKSFRMEDRSADRVEIDMCFDMKLVSADLGQFWSDAV